MCNGFTKAGCDDIRRHLIFSIARSMHLNSCTMTFFYIDQPFGLLTLDIFDSVFMFIIINCHLCAASVPYHHRQNTVSSSHTGFSPLPYTGYTIIFPPSLPPLHSHHRLITASGTSTLTTLLISTAGTYTYTCISSFL